MIDELDATEERMEFDTEVSVRNIRDNASHFNPGQEGDCDLCGEHFKRVVEVTHNQQNVMSCGRCRDKHGLG